MAEWARNKDRNRHIRELRSIGHSVREISRLIGCSKSTVSYHCRGTARLPFKAGADGINGGNAIKQIWADRIDAICAISKEEWSTVRTDPKTMGFLGLYWGEGNKARRKDGTGTGQIGITNNDPQLVKFVYDFLRPMTSATASADIIYYPLHIEADCKEFWSRILPDVMIQTKANTDDRSNIIWSDRCKWGRCCLRISDYHLFWKIITWVDCWRSEIGGEV